MTPGMQVSVVNSYAPVSEVVFVISDNRVDLPTKDTDIQRIVILTSYQTENQ